MKYFIVARHPNDLSEKLAIFQSEELAEKIWFFCTKKEIEFSPVAILASDARKVDPAIKAISSKFGNLSVTRDYKCGYDLEDGLKKLVWKVVDKVDLFVVIAHDPNIREVFAYGGELCGHENVGLLSSDYARANVLDCQTGEVFLL